MPSIDTFGLPAALRRKLSEGGITDMDSVYVMTPDNFIDTYALTHSQLAALNARLVAHGMKTLARIEPKRTPVRAAPKPGCPVDLSTEDEGSSPPRPCNLPKMKGKQRCVWHWLLAQPIEAQVEFADLRGQRRRERPDFVERRRVPQAEWPVGRRWCSECQSMIPLFYCMGSRCRAHASRAAHASMAKRVYDLDEQDYQALLAWQGGRCYVCGQKAHGRRLAIDHDHRTELVRGLLCASDEFGCNFTLRVLLNNLDMARRALAYVEKSPIDRMREGEPPVQY